MATELDNRPPPQHAIVVYEHEHHPISRPGLEHFPRQRNSNITLEQAVSFLSSGEIVVTNSYHGAYWGALLGRKIVISDPFSEKFLTIPWPTVTWESTTRLSDVARRAKGTSDLIDEYRFMNIEFSRKVRGLCV